MQHIISIPLRLISGITFAVVQSPIALVSNLNCRLEGLMKPQIQFQILTAMERDSVIIHFINSPYNFFMPSCPQNSDRVQFLFQFPERCVIKHLKNTKLYFNY